MLAEESNFEENSNIRLSMRRWIILVLLTLLQILSGIAFTCFGQISNFFVLFFHVTYTQVDWMTIAYDVAPIAFALPFTWITHRRIVGFRNLSLVCVLSFNTAFACFAISLMDTNLFWLSVVGQTLTGLGAFILMSTPSIFATVWFAENEVGTAISFNLMGLFAGYAIGGVLPTSVLTLSTNNSNGTQAIISDKDALLLIFSTCFVLSVVISLALCLTTKDVPPNPPNALQRLKRLEIAANTSSYWSNTKRLLSQKNFLLVCVVFGAVFQGTTVEITMMSEILEHSGKYHTNTDLVGGYVVGLYSLGNILGTIPAAMLINRYKQFGIISIISVWLVFLSALGIALGVIFGSLATAYVCNVAMGAVSQLAMVALYGILTEATQPLDETFVTLWFAGIIVPMGIIYGEGGRLVFDYLGSNAAILFQAVSMLLGAVCTCFFVTPQVDDKSVCEDDEETKLISESSSDPTDDDNERQPINQGRIR